jgi:PTS system ascorbate-specific IIA component
LHADDDRDVLEKEVSETIIELDTGQGVLILTDIYGATPSNIACSSTSDTVEIVAGLNLPMLIRVMNYPGLSLAELKQKAVSGGKEGIMQYQIKKDTHASQRN